MKAKVATIISGVNERYIAFEWLVKYIDRASINMIFIAIDCPSETFNDYLNQNKIKVYHLKYGGKSKLTLVKTIAKTISILRREQIDVVHTHVFDANLIGLIAATLVGIKKRIYTRHYSTAVHEYGKSRVKYDKIINWLATDIVAISKVVASTLIEKERVPRSKIRLIYHGFDLDEFRKIDPNRKENVLGKYVPRERGPIIGVVSTFQHLKGIDYIIFGFKKLLKIYPNAYLLLANAKGKDEDYYYDLLRNELPESSYKTIRFESDVAALFSIFDVFVHSPISEDLEAFGQVYIEAIAAGIPLVITKSGIAGEIFSNEKNAIVVDYKNADDIFCGLKKVLGDKSLSERIIKSSESLLEKFEINHMVYNLSALYKEKGISVSNNETAFN